MRRRMLPVQQLVRLLQSIQGYRARATGQRLSANAFRSLTRRQLAGTFTAPPELFLLTAVLSDENGHLVRRGDRQTTRCRLRERFSMPDAGLQTSGRFPEGNRSRSARTRRSPEGAGTASGGQSPPPPPPGALRSHPINRNARDP
ncbi:MAG: hypothetical protein M3Q40_02785 [Pseudomonadota bacterium]|nr:hypothetical protein [Pseudomonadota bacterium]